MSASIGFESLKLNRQLLNAIGELGYETPTEIQQKVIPSALSGQNIIGIAQTGTGKTAAFILPLLRILNYAQGNEPLALILAPTRELVIQIGSVASLMGKYIDLRIVTIYGGKGFSDQKKKLEAGCDIVVATPAQAMELYLSGHLILKKVKHFVMDEAERLLDFGFTGQIYSLLEVLPRKRQNMLFSATFSDRVKKISDDFMEFPVFIDVVPQVKTAAKVEQYLYTVISFQTKLNLLNHLLSDKEIFNKLIIFCKSKKNANRVAEVLQANYETDGINVLHGDKTQQTRVNAINRFREEQIRILIATDVAARGIDVPGVSHVINFDVPLVYEDYIHRIGRTGRAFASGFSVTFVEPQDEWHIKKIQKLAGISIKRLNMPESVEQVQPGKEEIKLREMEIDRQKRKDNPEFKGAFHERKSKSGKKGRHAGRK